MLVLSIFGICQAILNIFSLIAITFFDFFMNRLTSLIFLILSLSCIHSYAQGISSALVPYPNSISATGGRNFDISKAGNIVSGEGLEFAAVQLRESLERHFNYIGDGKSLIRLSIDKNMTDPGHYNIICNNKGLNITGSGPEAVLYGVRTLEQIFTGDISMTSSGKIRAFEIDDKPRLPFRAVMLDPARHFLPAKDVMFFIDQISRYKFNVLQLHLTDDQGWRFPVASHPELTDGQEHYTKEELKEIVEYAALRGIEVIPEFDMPGHCRGLAASHPELCCRTLAEGEPGLLMLCASVDGVYELYADILKEAWEIFPSDYVHLGGDESDFGNNWAACERCRRKISELGLDNAEELMGPFYERIIRTARELGKKVILWLEIGKGRQGSQPLFDYPEDVTLVSWRRFTGELGVDLAGGNGNDVIVASSDYCYFDFPQYPGDLPEKDNWGMPVTTLRQAYRLDPGMGGNPPHLKGVMCALWGEAIRDINRVCYMAFPRAMAIAEAGWTEMDRRGWDSFINRVYPNISTLMKAGVPVRAPFEAAYEDDSEWSLCWTEEFNGSRLEPTKWSKVGKGCADWNNTMSPEEDLVTVKDGLLVLKGRRDMSIKDSIVYVTGGVSSMGKASFKSAKFEIRAKFNCRNGFWPAIWLMPDRRSQWPNAGEIDIMEHLNSDKYVYQTVHSSWTLAGNRSNPVNYGTAAIDPDEFNVYGVEVREDRVDFFVNGKPAHSYPREEGKEGQFPFNDSPFYIILSNQIGGNWVGSAALDEEDCTLLEIDWVKVYRRN